VLPAKAPALQLFVFEFEPQGAFCGSRVVAEVLPVGFEGFFVEEAGHRDGLPPAKLAFHSTVRRLPLFEGRKIGVGLGRAIYLKN